MSATMTPNGHEKAECSRRAQAAFMAGDAVTGARFSVASTLPIGAAVPLATFDELQSDYRAWLIGSAGAAR